MLHNATSEFVQQLTCHPVSVFNMGFYDATINADIWYCYIHCYPFGTPGGFYLLQISRYDGQIRIFQCVVHPNAPLYVCGSLDLCLKSIIMVDHYRHQDLVYTHRAFDDYKRDQFIQHAFGVNYEFYMDQVIVSLIDFQDRHDCDTTEESCDFSFSQHNNIDTKAAVEVSTVDTWCLGIVNSPLCRDGNYSDKVRGYIAVEPTSSQFIGPDRAPVNLDSIDHYFDVTQIIRQSGLPNYKQVRVHLNSGLHIGSWKKNLQNIKTRNSNTIYNLVFLCPFLSSNCWITKTSQITFQHCNFKRLSGIILLRNTHMGHYRALLRTLATGHPEHKFAQISPILIRPKGQDKRQVILDLSYPEGFAMNDQVDRSRFYGNLFSLKFPSIDDIVKEICCHKNDAVISKIDLARAFCNLHVDTADALKLGIR